MTAKQRATRRLARKAHRAARIAESGFRVSKRRQTREGRCRGLKSRYRGAEMTAFASSNVGSILSMIAGVLAVAALGFVAVLTVLDFGPVWLDRIKGLGK
jgi:hypothetical protein